VQDGLHSTAKPNFPIAGDALVLATAPPLAPVSSTPLPPITGTPRP